MPNRTVKAAFNSLPLAERHAVLRSALAKITLLVAVTQRRQGIRLLEAEEYLQAGLKKLASKEFADIPNKAALIGLIFKQARFIVLPHARKLRVEKRKLKAEKFVSLDGPLAERLAAPNLNDQPYNNVIALGVDRLSAEVTGGQELKALFAWRFIELLRQDADGDFTKVTQGTVAEPGHLKFQTSRIARELGLSPNEVSKIIGYLREKLTLVIATEEARSCETDYQKLVRLLVAANTELDDTGTAQ